jgi:homocysteine S-methyltransferase
MAEAFLKSYADEFGPLNKPVLAGILPLYSVRHATFLNNEVPGINISETMIERLRQAGGDKEHRFGDKEHRFGDKEHRFGDKERLSAHEGVRIALELVDQMRAWVQGIYLMPQFSRYDLAAEIVEGCK